MNVFAQSIFSGLMSGAVYALLAVGLVITYRTSRVLNLAHGEAYMIAGLTASLLVARGVPLWLAAACALLLAVALSIGLERFVLRPRAGWPVSSLVLVTLAVAFTARGAAFALAGPDALSFPRFFTGAPLRIGGGAMPPEGIALVVVALAATCGVALLLGRTHAGRALRAIAENADAAALQGIDVDAMRTLAFGIGGALAALAALALVPLVSVDFQAGLQVTLRGFIAAALAGMAPGPAIVCGFALGIFEALVTSYAGALSQDPIVFLVLIAVAVWQSRRLRFGGRERA